MIRQIVPVALGERAYEIHIGPGVLADAGVLDSAGVGERVFVVSNPTVADLYLPTMRTALGARRLDVALIPDGEGAKNLDEFARLLDQMVTAGHDRQTTVLALGGGVVGDLAGFVAACYQRGVPFVQVPTTLLAQVDSSVGGKTAVNHRLGKNLIGAFHQPSVVLADTQVLNSLPLREVRAGLAEVIKYGVIADGDFFAWLEDAMDLLVARDEAALTRAIRQSCEIKARIVAADEREAGQRALLNLGHTFGHAIEQVQGYGHWLHGEAVGVGMVLAADLAGRRQWLTGDEAERIETLVRRAGLPTDISGQPVDTLVEAMGLDKKAVGGRKRFILPQAIGQAAMVDDVADREVVTTLRARA